jgi:hypothetical protein
MGVDQLIQAAGIICGAIIILGTTGTIVVKAVSGATKPYKELAGDIRQIKSRLAQVEVKLDADWERMDKMAESDQALFHGMLALLKNARTHNEHGIIEAAEEELQKHLIKK